MKRPVDMPGVQVGSLTLLAAWDRVPEYDSGMNKSRFKARSDDGQVEVEIVVNDPEYASAGHMGDPGKTIQKKLPTLTTDDGELVSPVEGDDGAFRLMDRNIVVRRVD